MKGAKPLYILQILFRSLCIIIHTRDNGCTLCCLYLICTGLFNTCAYHISCNRFMNTVPYPLCGSVLVHGTSKVPSFQRPLESLCLVITNSHRYPPPSRFLCCIVSHFQDGPVLDRVAIIFTADNRVFCSRVRFNPNIRYC